MKKFASFFLPLLLALIPVGGQAQMIPVNPKFGAVSKDEVSLNAYPPDTSANVLVLYRKKAMDIIFEPSRGYALDFSRITTFRARIKVLKESGKGYADFKIPYRVRSESVTGIRVVTYNLEEGGRVVSSELGKKMVFDEELSDDYHVVSFSPENVKVGSVVEVEYVFKSRDIHDFGDLEMQKDVPINLSEMSISYADCFTVNRLKRGAVPCTSSSDTSNGDVLFPGGLRYSYRKIIDNYKAVDVPALKKDSFCYCPSLYRLSLDYEISRFQFEDLASEDFSRTWQDVDNFFRSEGVLKDFYDKSFLSANLNTLLASAGDEALQVGAVIGAVLSKVEFDGRSRVFPTAAKALKSGKGSTADVNALVASALNSAGFTADPVFLKYRSEGLVFEIHPATDAFNTVILRVKAPSGALWYVDASLKDGYLNVLDPDCLVENARVITKDEAGWVDLTGLTTNQSMYNVEMKVQPGGEVEGMVADHSFNQCSLGLKEYYRSFEGEDAFISRLEEESGYEISDFSIERSGEWTSDVSYSFRFRYEPERGGDLVYIRPFFKSFHPASAFREEKRSIPVEFPYPDRTNYTCIIHLPEGYAVESLPAPVSFRSEVMAGSVVMQPVYSESERKILIQYRFRSDVMAVAPEYYQDFRAFWEKLSSIAQTTVVLKKI